MAITQKRIHHPMVKTYQNIGLSQLDEVVQDIVPHLKTPKIICFHAEMGAGKTTIIRAFLNSLGINNPDGSPTYALIHEYQTEDMIAIYHMDAYRISSENMALESGVAEMFKGNAIFFVEWPEKIITFLPDDYISIAITLDEGNTRTYTVNYDHRS